MGVGILQDRGGDGVFHRPRRGPVRQDPRREEVVLEPLVAGKHHQRRAAEVRANRRIGAITAPGDRRDDDIRALGRLSACLDRAIVKEDPDRRGRRDGDIAELIREGLIEGGMSDDHIEIVLKEMDAVNRVLEILQEGDLAIVLADDVAGVLALLAPRSSGRATI